MTKTNSRSSRIQTYLEAIDDLGTRLRYCMPEYSGQWATDSDYPNSFESCEIAAAQIATETLKECVREEAWFRSRIKNLLKQISELKSKLQSLTQDINQISQELSEKEDKLIKTERRFEDLSILKSAAKFPAGGLEKIRVCLTEKKEKGIKVDSILMSLEEMVVSDRIEKFHLDGIPIHFSAAVKPGMFILFCPKPQKRYRHD